MHLVDGEVGSGPVWRVAAGQFAIYSLQFNMVWRL